MGIADKISDIREAWRSIEPPALFGPICPEADERAISNVDPIEVSEFLDKLWQNFYAENVQLELPFSDGQDSAVV